MAMFTSNTPHVSQIQAFDPAPATVRAAAYLLALKQFAAPAGECDKPESQTHYFQELKRQLESALAGFEKSAAGWRHGVEDFQSNIELDWCCNQCEYWLGPAENADLARINLKWAEMRCRGAAMTALEFTAVKLLVLATGLLIQARQNPLALLPRPARTCKWIYKSMERCARNAAEKIFALRLLKRRFMAWLKRSFL